MIVPLVFKQKLDHIQISLFASCVESCLTWLSLSVDVCAMVQEEFGRFEVLLLTSYQKSSLVGQVPELSVYHPSTIKMLKEK